MLEGEKFYLFSSTQFGPNHYKAYFSVPGTHLHGPSNSYPRPYLEGPIGISLFQSFKLVEDCSILDARSISVDEIMNDDGSKSLYFSMIRLMKHLSRNMKSSKSSSVHSQCESSLSSFTGGSALYCVFALNFDVIQRNKRF